MAKKKRTRQEKVIRQLKRELNQLKDQKAKPRVKSTPRQGAISSSLPEPKSKKAKLKKPAKSVLFYDPKLVRNDLIKSLLLTLGVITLEVVLYLRLR